MKTLLLIRHAEASPAVPGYADRERTLTAQGHQQVAQQGEAAKAWLGRIPKVFCSPAQRAIQTLEGLRPWLTGAPEISYDEALYHTAPEEILHRAQSTPEFFQALLMVGHNPGMALFLRYVDERETYCPPATIACLEADTMLWRDLAFTHFRLKQLFLPHG